MKLFNLTIASLLAISAVALAEGGSTTVGPANPASVLCVKAGGQSINFTEPTGGQLAVCVFGERGAIEEWTFFRYKHGEKSAAIKAFLKNDGKFEPINEDPMPHPAGAYCERVAGGKKIVITAVDGSESGLCQFADGSMIEEWTLMRGFTSELNTDLLSAIKKSRTLKLSKKIRK